MKLLNTFFGMILRKSDVDYQSSSSRDAYVQTNIDLTRSNGGIIQGLEVYPSVDNSSIIIQPGVFYSKGSYNSTNSLGGGERGRIYTTQSFGGLPITSPISNEPSYLLVYAKTVSSNQNPNPTDSQVVVTSKNIQTGENVPGRQYTAGIIVISNKIRLGEVANIQGVPLALLQVGYKGKVLITPNPTITSIDTSVRLPYIIGNAVDVLNSKILPNAIVDNTIINRMIASGTITGDKMADNTIGTNAIGQWDGSSSFDSTTGSGIGTLNLKNGAVTEIKLNPTGSLHNFSTLNVIRNSSFNLSATGLDYWNVALSDPLNASISYSNSEQHWGIQSAIFQGSNVSGNASSLSLYQNVDFGNDRINERPVMASFWIKVPENFSTGVAGTNGINGVIELQTSGVTVGGAHIFDSYSGSSTAGWIKLQTQTPISYSGSDPINSIKLSISGNFVNRLYVDNVFMGLTSIMPEWSPAPNETFLGGGIDTTQIVAGQFPNSRLGTQTVDNRVIQDFSIEQSKINPAYALIPLGAIIIWDQTSSCPAGFTEETAFAGLLPIGVNNSGTSTISSPGLDSPGMAGGSARIIGTTQKTDDADSDHSHGVQINGGDVGGGGTSRAFPGYVQSYGQSNSHKHATHIPFRTVRFCRYTG